MDCPAEHPKLLYGVVAGFITVAVLAFLFYNNQLRNAASSDLAEDAAVEEYEEVSDGSSEFSDTASSASDSDAHDAFFPKHKHSQPTPITRQFARKSASTNSNSNQRPRSAGDLDPPKQSRSDLFTRSYRPLIMPQHLQMQAHAHAQSQAF